MKESSVLDLEWKGSSGLSIYYSNTIGLKQYHSGISVLWQRRPGSSYRLGAFLKVTSTHNMRHAGFVPPTLRLPAQPLDMEYSSNAEDRNSNKEPIPFESMKAEYTVKKVR